MSSFTMLIPAFEIIGMHFAVNKITIRLKQLFMKTLYLFIFAIVCVSCTRKDETRPINIEVNLKDDVSPVEGEISIPGHFDYIDWTFEEIYKPLEDSPNPATHIFSTKGPAKITVVAYRNNTREMFIGNSEISVPDVAKRLKIAGFCFKDLQGSNPYNLKPVSISLTYQKLGTATAKTFSIPPAAFSPADTIYFPEPIIYDIDGLENGGFYDYEIFIKIKTNQENDPEFMSSFNLTGKYLWEHPSNPDFIYVNNVRQNQISAIYLVCNWMPN